MQVSTERKPETDTAETALFRLIQIGSDFTGALAGACMAALQPSPDGVFAGAAAAMKHTLGSLAGEILSRTLSRREQLRAGAVVTYATAKIRENLAAGQHLRSDNFFSEELVGRSVAAEVAEGVVLAAQRDHEEKKLPLYGNLLANLAFSSLFSRAQANLLARLAEKLSYRQLCLLALFSKDSRVRARLPDSEYRELNGPQLSLLHETYELILQELLRPTARNNDRIDLFLTTKNDIVPARTQTVSVGHSLFVLMELSTSLDVEKDIEEMIVILQPGSEGDAKRGSSRRLFG
jgi:hypothetical protein